MNQEISHFLSNAVGMMKEQGVIGGRSDFAARCGITENVLNNILYNRTLPTIGQFWTIQNIIFELSEEYAYKYLHDQIFPKKYK